MKNLLLNIMQDRIENSKDDGDETYLNNLLLQMEFVMKISVLGIVACLHDDMIERHRYSLEHKLIRADGIGSWGTVMTRALTGAASQWFDDGVQSIRNEMTERVSKDDWRYEVCDKFNQAAQNLDVPSATELSNRVKLQSLWDLIPAIRNRTKGHGAPTLIQATNACPLLSEGIKLYTENVLLFKFHWVHLHKNISGKYRVTSILNSGNEFNHLKNSNEYKYENGVYFYADGMRQARLILFKPNSSDVFLPNGNHRSQQFEMFSYATNLTERCDGLDWSLPPGQLPKSQTTQKANLDLLGDSFSNVPEKPRDYIHRQRLEHVLEAELRKKDHHPIVTLTGPGGIGKTTIALTTIHKIANNDSPYEYIMWISARDIDLLAEGPKTVAPDVSSIDDIAKLAMKNLVEILDISDEGAKNPKGYFQEILTSGIENSNTLFVFDNFETMSSPADTFTWIDTYIRPNNKALITTRTRDFVGDYPIEIGGMETGEAHELIAQESIRLNITDIINKKYIEKLINESEAHPYVMKIMLGEVATTRRASPPQRLVADSDALLRALFERTYESIKQTSQRIFLLLSSWSSLVPRIAIIAVLMRPTTGDNERIDVSAALDELKRFSLITETAISQDNDNEIFVSVPMITALYGQRKLASSTYKFDIEEDKKLLIEFGAVKSDGVRHGVYPRIQTLFRSVSSKVGENPQLIYDYLPILEFLATKFPQAYLELADLIRETTPDRVEDAEGYVKRFIEESNEPNLTEKAWEKIASFSQDRGNFEGELEANVNVALSPNATLDEVSAKANNINHRIKNFSKNGYMPSINTLSRLIRPVIERMEREIQVLSATDCSRLAWLYLTCDNKDKATEITKIGLEKDSENEYCQRLYDRLLS